LNAGDPPARLAQIRDAVDPRLLLTEPDQVGLARASGFTAPEMIDVSALPIQDAEPIPRSPISPDDLAVLISTSGSTGRPKVVMQSHRTVLHNVLRYTNGLHIVSDDRFALLAALSGGQGLVTTWTALLNGCTLCPFPIAERGVTRLADWLAECGITVFDTIPSVL